VVPRLRLLLIALALGAGPPPGRTAERAVCEVDVGGPLDSLFLGSGWYDIEGPYPQFGGIWSAPCRWASQGATVLIPLFPGRAALLEMRAMVGDAPEQRLRLTLDGELLASLAPSADLLYRVPLPVAPTSRRWGELRLETSAQGPRSPGDGRDLRVAVDWLRVSADAPPRNIVSERLRETGRSFPILAVDRPPARWRYRHDPNAIGERYAARRWYEAAYDDSGFDTVSADHRPALRRGEAAWYRAWVELSRRADEVRRSLRLPGDGFERDGLRQVWVNGVLQPRHRDPSLTLRSAAEALRPGINFLVVRVLKGALPAPSGATIVRPPEWSAVRAGSETVARLDRLVLAPGRTDARMTVKLLAPSGRAMAFREAPVGDLGEGLRGVAIAARWPLREYGEHTLVVVGERGDRERFPVHHLGIHFFHWGWYSAAEGTTWDGFRPTSNAFIDQLFERVGEWGTPHHSISWGGAIFAPGTGFHRVQQKDYVGLFRDAFASGSLEFVGMPYPPRNICADFGESLLRSLRRSRSIYASELGQRPRHFACHDSTMTPLLPQVLRLCGYDSIVIAENWWGQGRSVPNSRDLVLANPDGTRVRVLDSWYHGISPVEAARRAVELGKPAVLCNEEFACLDPTVFLAEADRSTLASEGIFVTPVTLARYEALTASFASQVVHRGDAGLCYKGWTGGSEGEVEYEKANRLLETRLVALESLAALATTLGIAVDPAPIEQAWDLSLRAHECHLHWGNGYPHLTQQMTVERTRAERETLRIAAALAGRVAGEGAGVLALNPHGWRASALLSVDAPGSARSLAGPGGRVFPIQPDPDARGRFLAAVRDLPPVGWIRLRATPRPAPGGARAVRRGRMARLSNEWAVMDIHDNGAVTVAGAPLLRQAMRLWIAKPIDRAPATPISTEAEPLNLAHFETPRAADPVRIVAAGPAAAIAECTLVVPSRPGLRMVMRYTLASGAPFVRLRLTLDCGQPVPLGVRGGTPPHEGAYIPGLFLATPFPPASRPMADMAYCLTDQVLHSTNHETFLNVPFRYGTYNALSLSGPATGEYAVLTRGLHDFFVVRSAATRYRQAGAFLGLALGHSDFPMKGRYEHEVALMVPSRSGRRIDPVTAYQSAHALLAPPMAVRAPAVARGLPRAASLLEASGHGVHVAGVDRTEGEVRARLVNLTTRYARVTMKGMANLSRARLLPGGRRVVGAIVMPPRAVRELRFASGAGGARSSR